MKAENALKKENNRGSLLLLNTQTVLKIILHLGRLMPHRFFAVLLIQRSSKDSSSSRDQHPSSSYPFDDVYQPMRPCMLYCRWIECLRVLVVTFQKQDATHSRHF